MSEKNLSSQQEYIEKILLLIDELKIEIYNSKQLKIDTKLMEFVEVYIGFTSKFQKEIADNEYMDINSMNQVLLKIEEVLRTKDYVILADLLLYQLGPMLQKNLNQ